jgi:hypothetical protein
MESMGPNGHGSPIRYRLYVDESGDHTYKLLDDPGHRYLALLGVWFQQGDEYAHFADDLDKLKRDIFGHSPDEPIVLHRSDIINRRGPFGALKKPGLQEQFDAGLLNMVSRARFTMVCVVIDKKTHLARYSRPFNPYHYCLEALLDRYCGWLNHQNALGDVMGESRGGVEDLQLKEEYRRIYTYGTIQSRKFNRPDHKRALASKEIKLKRKELNIPGLQLADILAHPVRQACLAEKRQVSDAGDVFGRDLYEVAKAKFNKRGLLGRIEGYGKVFLSQPK